MGNVFKKILIANDGSENARRAISHGIDIAKISGAEVYAVYVVSDEHAKVSGKVMGWAEPFEEYLTDRGELATTDVEKSGKETEVKVEKVLLKGSPAEQILDYSEKNDIDLVVMGTQGLTGIKRFLIGSVAENVIRHSKVPVLVVR